VLEPLWERVYPLPYPSPTDPLPAERPKVSYPGAENRHFWGGIGYETFRRFSPFPAPGYETFGGTAGGCPGATSLDAKGGVRQGSSNFFGNRVRDFRSPEALQGQFRLFRHQGTRLLALRSRWGCQVTRLLALRSLRERQKRRLLTPDPPESSREPFRSCLFPLRIVQYAGFLSATFVCPQVGCDLKVNSAVSGCKTLLFTIQPVTFELSKNRETYTL